jgi:hypothetical protein
MTGETSKAITIERFVRDELGCDCPAQVFEHVDVVHAHTAFSDLPGDYLLRIGGRLLVLVVLAPSWRPLAGVLGELFERGRAERDAEGFNRFRLVVATEDPQSATRELGAILKQFPLADDRLHLHAVSPAQLPDFA